MNIKMSPYIRVAWDHWLEEDFVIGPRVIFDYELICIESGELDVQVDGANHHVVPGDILFFSPRQTHTMRGSKQGDIHQPHIHFDFIQDASSPYVYVSFADLPDIDPKEYGLFRQDILKENGIRLPTHIRMKDDRAIVNLLMAIIGERP